MLSVDFPWATTEPGQGFFVPCLDVAETRERGLRAAIPYRMKVEATPMIRGGLLGVWFCVRRPSRGRGPSSPSRSPAA